jgi:hypothetical protein
MSFHDAQTAPDATPPSAPPSEATGAPPRRSRLGPLTTGVILVVLGAAWLLDQVGIVDVGVVDVLALVLLVTGLGLLVGTWWGRSRGLILLGVLLAVLLSAAGAVQTTAQNAKALSSGGVGQRTWAPGEADDVQPSYELGVGQATLDLSETAFDDELEVRAATGMGKLTVVVPQDVDVTVDGTIHLGRMELLGVPTSTIGTASQSVTDTVDQPQADLSLEVEMGMGKMVVQRR